VPASDTFECPSCGAATLGHFCGNCGEKEVSEEDYALRHYLVEMVAGITLLESKFLRSVWLAVTKPGYLSAEHFRGRRIRYTRPLQLFIFLNVVYYFSITLFSASTFTTPLATQLHMNNYYPAYAAARVDHKLQREQISYEALERKYNQRTSVLSKTTIFLLIPMFAVLFYTLFFKKRKYLVEHIVVATHFWSFNLILLGVLLPAVSLLLIWFAQRVNLSAAYVTDDGLVSAVLQVALGVYLFLMFRRCYAVTRWYSTLVAASIAWSFFHIVWLYRFFLFELTMGSV